MILKIVIPVWLRMLDLWVRRRGALARGMIGMALIQGATAATPALLWESGVGGQGVALGVDGSVITLGGSNVFALHPSTGKVLWQASPSSRPLYGAIPVVAPDGAVLVADSRTPGTVFALEGGTGGPRWASPLAYAPSGDSMAVDGDNRVFVCDQTTVYALRVADGTRLWATSFPTQTPYHPVVGADGTVYVVLGDSRLVALEGGTGHQRWEYRPVGSIHGVPICGADATVYLGTGTARLFDRVAGKVEAIHAVTGRQRWQLTGEPEAMAQGLVLGNGADLFVGWTRNIDRARTQGSLASIDSRTGIQRYSEGPNWRSTSVPAAAADGSVLISAIPSLGPGFLWGMDGAKGSSRWFIKVAEDAQPSPIIGPNGTIYVATESRGVLAIAGASAPADSAWPLPRHDARNSRSAQVQGLPRILEPPVPTAAPEHGILTFSVLAGGSGPLEYQWYKEGLLLEDDARIQGSRSAQLEIRGVNPADAGEYRVTVLNALGTAESPSVGAAVRPVIPGEMLWSLPEDPRFQSAPSVGSDGRLFVTLWNRDRFITEGARVRAFDGNDGRTLWETGMVYSASASPMVGGNGLVYVHSFSASAGRSVLYAFHEASGHPEWLSTFGGLRFSNLAMDSGGQVWLASADTLYAVDALTGATNRTFKAGVGASLATSVAVRADGSVVWIKDGQVAVLHPETGALIWESKLSGNSTQLSAVGADGAVYVGCSDDYSLSSLDGVSGTLRWRFKASSPMPRGAVIGESGAVFVGSNEGLFFSLDPIDGVILWEANLGSSSEGAAVASDGTVFAGDNRGRVRAFDARTGAILWEYAGAGGAVRHPTLGPNGTIYVSALNGFYALGGRATLAASSWPMERGGMSKQSSLASRAPRILQTPSDAVGAAGQRIVLEVIAAGEAPLAYQWRRNGEILEGATEPQWALDSVGAGSVGGYDVIVANSRGAVTSRVAEVRLAAPPTLVSEPEDQVALPGATAVFRVDAEGAPPLTYQWRFDGKLLSGETGSSLARSNLAAPMVGGYDAVVSNPWGSVTSRIATLVLGGGALQVDLLPGGAVAAGARWRRAGTLVWRASGDVEHGLVPGPTPLEFLDPPGWTAPQGIVVLVPSQGTNVVLQAYSPVLGRLQVRIEPPVLGAMGIRWRRVGTAPWFESGEVEADVPLGPLEVEFENPGSWTIESPVRGTSSGEGRTTLIALFSPADRPVAVRVFSADGTDRTRIDAAAAIDGRLETASFLSSSGTLGPTTAAFDLGVPRRIDWLRVAKHGDTDAIAGIDTMDLQILVTSDSGPLHLRSYRPVTGLLNGYASLEKCRALAVLEEGSVENDTHDWKIHGWYSLLFDAFEATAVAIRFARDPSDPAAWTHYAVSEVQVLSAPGLPGEPPTLSVTVSGAGVRLSWPATAGEFALESSARLGAGQDWIPVDSVPERIGEGWTVTLPAELPARFYRLKR